MRQNWKQSANRPGGMGMGMGSGRGSGMGRRGQYFNIDTFLFLVLLECQFRGHKPFLYVKLNG
jgi:hypothetical protein